MDIYRTALRRTGGDEGIALVISIAVMIVSMALITLVISLSIQANRASGRDRQRTVSVGAAEAGIDASFATIQSAGTTLPCNWPASGTAAVRASPDVVSSRATITYLTSTGVPLGHCLTASDVTSPTSTFQAVVDGYGTASAPSGGAATSSRHMQALVKLSPVYANSLDKAIFSEGNLTFTNQTTLTGDGSGANADVYTNANFVCANNQNYAGSINSQGNVTVQGTCTIAGDAWARGSVSNSAGSNGVVGGRVLASTGNIALPGTFSVNGTLLAGGGISWGGCATSGKCFANTTVAPPPAVPFPKLFGNSSSADNEWIAAGYTIFTDNTCASIKNRIIDIYAKKGTKTLVKTSCAVNFANDKDILLSNDLSVYAYGGFNSSQQVGFKSNTNGVKRTLYWIVPFEAAARPCTSPGITTDNQFNFSTDVDMFVYSPCNIAFSNNSDHIGQVYGGSAVSINNQFSMQFKKVPVFGVDPTSTPLLSYKLDIVYKREVS